VGCKVRTTSSGYLAYRLRSKLVPGYQSQERTGLRDTPTNRKRLDARARVIADEMAAGSFDYVRWFPNGSKAALLKPPPAAPRVLTLREYADTVWLPRKKPPLVRAWCAYDYRKHLRNHILPAFGDLPFDTITPAALERFRAELLKKPLALKSVRNVIDATFRALYRDARQTDKLVTGDPFATLKWPRRPAHKPDPFDEGERDSIVKHFRRKRPHYHAFVLTAFWTGCRPSELVALRWGDVDLRTAKLMVRRSRTLGEDNAPKTAASERTIDLARTVVDVLRGVKPLHVTDEDFVFRNTEGRPIFADNFGKYWHPALRAVGVRPRKFYATRHTFISVALTRGVRIKWLAEYVGTSVDMIEKHYGRYLGGDTRTQLALLGSPNLRGDGVPISGVKPGKSRAVSGSRVRRKSPGNQ